MAMLNNQMVYPFPEEVFPALSRNHRRNLFLGVARKSSQRCSDVERGSLCNLLERWKTNFSAGCEGAPWMKHSVLQSFSGKMHAVHAEYFGGKPYACHFVPESNVFDPLTAHHSLVRSAQPISGFRLVW